MEGTTMNARSKKKIAVASAAMTATALAGAVMSPTLALMAPGTPGRDVHVGADDDNADNPFIQPAGVAAPQHMNNTDVLVGRGHDDLLIGKLGGDTLLGNQGADILVGGPEAFTAPNSDVLLGESGKDINIWAPGDGSDAFVGHTGRDTMIFAPFVTRPNGSPVLERFHDRKIPRVDIDSAPQFSCDIVTVTPDQDLGFDHLVRFSVNDVLAVTVRQEKVERVFCPSPDTGSALVADLTAVRPKFRPVALSDVKGVTGAILAP
jgi:hypothetical protein